MPTCCNHCENPPCHSVCPTGATYLHETGLVGIDENRCMGCGYCVVACPFRARFIFHPAAETDQDSARNDNRPEGTATDRRGVCVKCSFCQSRIDLGLARGLVPGIDEGATPACVLTCSAEALFFGDVDDSQSEVSRLIRENPTYRLQEHLGTEPFVYYLLPESWAGVPEAEIKEP